MWRAFFMPSCLSAVLPLSPSLRAAVLNLWGGTLGGGVLITLPQGSLRSSENTCIYIAIHNSLHSLILCLVLNVIYTGYAWVYRSSPKLLPQDPTSNYNASFPLHLFSGHLNLSLSPQAVLPSLPNPAAQAKTLGPPCDDFPFSLSLILIQSTDRTSSFKVGLQTDLHFSSPPARESTRTHIVD